MVGKPMSFLELRQLISALHRPVAEIDRRGAFLAFRLLKAETGNEPDREIGRQAIEHIGH